MDPAGNEHDSLAVRNQVSRLLVSPGAELARIRQQTLNTLVFLKPAQVLWRADGSHNEGPAHRRLAELFKLHPIAGGRKFLEILDHALPTREFAIITRSEPEHIFRSSDWSSRARQDAV